MSELTCSNHPQAEGSIVRCTRCQRAFCGDCLVHLGGRAVCADCKIEQVMDARSGVDSSALDLAGLGSRFAALFLDRIVVFAPLIVIFLISQVENGEEHFPVLLVTGIVLWAPLAIAYEPVLLKRSGQTWGKRAAGVRVVQVDGAPLTWGQAWGRSMCRLVIMLASSLIDYVPAFCTKEKTALHDMLARTRVVRA